MRSFHTLVAVLVLLICSPAKGESHRATRLGNPATRFAPPLGTPDDARALFRDPQLQPDIAAVLKQWGWPGNINDLFAAAATAKITGIRIHVGEAMPFMASRKNGRPECLRNVTWAGKEPAPAYAFNFASNGRRYRCVTPKACSNFFLEDLGQVPRFGLMIDCSVPNQVTLGRNIEACLTVRNTGNVTEPHVTVTLPMPRDTMVAGITAEGHVTNDALAWEILNLAPGATKRVCATLRARQPGRLSLSPTVASVRVQPVQSSCETLVTGLSALLLQTADDPDPVPVGETTTYTVKVTNQGTADDTNVRVVVEFPAEVDPVSASTAGEVTGKTVTFPPFPRLGPKEAFEYSIIAKGAKVGDARVKFIRTSDGIPAPTSAEESTRIY